MLVEKSEIASDVLQDANDEAAHKAPRHDKEIIQGKQ